MQGVCTCVYSVFWELGSHYTCRFCPFYISPSIHIAYKIPDSKAPYSVPHVHFAAGLSQVRTPTVRSQSPGDTKVCSIFPEMRLLRGPPTTTVTDEHRFSGLKGHDMFSSTYGSQKYTVQVSAGAPLLEAQGRITSTLFSASFPGRRPLPLVTESRLPLLATWQANESEMCWGKEEPAAQEDGRLVPQNNHLTGVWKPGSCID